MAGKIINFEQSKKISKKLHALQKKIALAGGCFDILHEGHISFLHASKKEGDILFVLLESDERIRLLKGKSRPINSQKHRADILASLKAVDYIVLLPDHMENATYDKVISGIKPAIITTTKGDPHFTHKKRQAAKVGGKVKEVIERMPEHSTTELLKNIRYE